MPIIHREDGVPPSKSRLVLLGGSFNDTVTSMSSHSETFTPPRGKKWQIVNMELLKGAATGAASGHHQFTLKQSWLNTMKGESNFGSKISWKMNEWETADKAQHPATNGAQLTTLHTMVADADNPLVVTYGNYTNVSNTRTGLIYIYVLESPII